MLLLIVKVVPEGMLVMTEPAGMFTPFTYWPRARPPVALTVMRFEFVPLATVVLTVELTPVKVSAVPAVTAVVMFVLSVMLVFAETAVMNAPPGIFVPNTV